MGDPANTWVPLLKDLASALDVSQNTITQWRKRKDWPQTKVAGKGYYVPKFRAWVEKNKLGQKSTTETVNAKDREAAAKARLVELKVLDMEGKTMPTDDVTQWITAREAEAKKIITERLCSKLPPRLAEITEAVLIRQMIEDVIDQAFAAVANVRPNK